MQIVANNLGNALVPDLTGDVEAVDNRTPRHRLIFEQDPPAGTIVSVGTHIVTVTVTDLKGNSRDCHQTLVVVGLATVEPVNILDPAEETVIELTVVAETAFDGSYVILTWTFPDGVDASSTVFIQRDGLLIATATGTTYTDTTVVSGETYVYLVTVSTLAGGTAAQCCIVPPGSTVFSNTAQTATALCPAGTSGESKTVTVPANTFTSTSSQADADALALASAASQATALLCCCSTDCLTLYDDCFPYGYGYEDCLSVYDENCYPYGYGFGEFPVFPSSDVDHWWRMEELNVATRLDAIGRADLTVSVVSGTIDDIAGKVNLAVEATGSNANLQYTGLEMVYANTGFTLFGWVKTNSTANTLSVSRTLTFGGSVDGPILRLFPAADNSILFRWEEGISSDPRVDITLANAVNQWTFFRCWHNGPNGTFRMQLNNGSIGESLNSWTPAAHTNALIIFGGNATQRIWDEVGIIERVITPAEATFLYNNGNGRTWPFA